MSHQRCSFRAWLRSLQGRSVLFSLSMLLIMLLIASMVTSYSQQTLWREIVARNTTQVDAAAEQLALSLDKTMDMQRELLYDEDINRLGVTPGYYSQPQQVLAMLRVMDRMFMLTNSSSLVSEAIFLAPSIGKAITASGVEALSTEDFQRANDLCVNQTQALIEMDGQFYIMMAYPTYNYYLKENGASYLLCLRLNQQALAAYLSAISAQEGEVILLFSNDGKLVSSLIPDGLAFDAGELFALAQGASAFEVTLSNGQRYLASAARNTSSTKTLTLVKLQLYDRAFSVLNLQGTIFVGMILLLILINLGYIFHMWHRIHKPLHKLSEAFAGVERGDFSIRIHHARDDDFAEMFQRFNQMNQRLGELIEQVYMQTIRTQRAELKQLQSQINPHFLYNNLFTIRSLAQLGDTDTIETLAAELGEYFRYVTRTGNQEVSLEEEVAHARNFAAIQDMRFSSRIRMTFPALPPAMAQAVVPRLVLQPLLENAYLHGLEHASRGEIRLSFLREAGDVLICVEDSGDSLTEDVLAAMTASLTNPDAQETTGLINIHRRLRLRFGPGYGLTFTRSPLGGLRVTMRIPLDRQEAAHAKSPDC